VPGRARTPGRHQRLGGPLPRQRPNTTTARPTAPELWSASDARRGRRWGLPAVSRGYTQPWGWLPSPYSPLRHWPDPKTGPVRLACLIHAANVHSEPGSNPSKMSRSPATPRSRDESSGSRSPPERVEEICWSHRRSTIAIGPTTSPDALAGPRIPAIGPTEPRRTCAGPCEPSRRPDPGGPTGRGVLTTLARRLPSRVLDATNTYLRLVVFG
jgi:hypothetical protein